LTFGLGIIILQGVSSRKSLAGVSIMRPVGAIWTKYVTGSISSASKWCMVDSGRTIIDDLTAFRRLGM
jgi:hypothetical protein